MKLSKNAWIIWGFSLAVVIVLMAFIPFVRNTVWWIGAVSTVLMYGVCALAFFLAFRRKGIESKLLGWPIFRVGYTALAVQLIVGFTIMGIAVFCPVWAAVIAEAVVFGIAGICLTVKESAREVVTLSEAKVTENTAAWKAIRTRAAALAGSDASPLMKKLAEEIRFADPMPTDMDDEISGAITVLENDPSAENAENVLRLLARRKAEAKASKEKH